MSVSLAQPLQFFDAYCGIGICQQPQPDWIIEPEKLLAAMDHYGIGKALVYPNYIRAIAPPERGTEILRECCRISNRFEPLAPIYPHPYPDLPSVESQLERAKAMGARAAWCNAVSAPFTLLTYGEIISRCAKLQLPILVEEAGDTIAQLDRICESFPSLRVIYAGGSFRSDPLLFPLLRKHENIHVCLGPAYIPPWGPMRFVESFGPKRLLFGSGMPRCTPGGVVGHVAYAGLSLDERQLIAGGNLERLLKEAWL